MKKNTDFTKCPFCKSVVEVDIDFAIKNGRIFCNACCKAFDIKVGEEEEDSKPKKKEVDDFDYW